MLENGVVDMTFQSVTIAQNTKAGQFVHIRTNDGIAPLLRRPISICDVDVQTGDVRILFQIKGEGTRLIAMKNIGDSLDVIGPLGNGFTVDPRYKRPLLIGGGIGVFPLLLLSKKISTPVTCLGFRNQSQVVLENDFSQTSHHLLISTDDGSYGEHCYVPQLAENQLENHPIDIIYACGPEVMIKCVVEMANAKNIPCQVSMEQRMGCGIGACLVCACKTKKGYEHVCKTGPVYWASEVIFDA
ncbi:MAG: dihydroorotate dehydrogenase electron transfer subunit [Hyphomonadaceae bacterium]|nr:dihydroorotate dehydrogenase electron transfer subunit [Clostridia bacterium]